MIANSERVSYILFETIEIRSWKHRKLLIKNILNSFVTLHIISVSYNKLIFIRKFLRIRKFGKFCRRGAKDFFFRLMIIPKIQQKRNVNCAMCRLWKVFSSRWRCSAWLPKWELFIPFYILRELFHFCHGPRNAVIYEFTLCLGIFKIISIKKFIRADLSGDS